MTTSPKQRLERQRLHAALDRARAVDSGAPINAAALHRDLGLSCDPATSRRWVQAWRLRTETALGSTSETSSMCHCGVNEALAQEIAERVMDALAQRLASGAAST